MINGIGRPCFLTDSAAGYGMLGHSRGLGKGNVVNSLGNDSRWLSWTGMETHMIFSLGLDLPGFASFPLLEIYSNLIMRDMKISYLISKYRFWSGYTFIIGSR